MIQSYIDWTPLILDHWKELLFKQCVTINNGRDYKNIESTEGVPVIGSGGQFTYCTEEMYNGEVIFLGRKGTIDKPIYTIKVHFGLWIRCFMLFLTRNFVQSIYTICLHVSLLKESQHKQRFLV